MDPSDLDLDLEIGSADDASDTVDVSGFSTSEPVILLVDFFSDTVLVNGVDYGPYIPVGGGGGSGSGSGSGDGSALQDEIDALAAQVAAVPLQIDLTATDLKNALLDAIASNEAASKQAIDALRQAGQDAALASQEAVDALKKASTDTAAASKQAIDALAQANQDATDASDDAVRIAHQALDGVEQIVASATSGGGDQSSSVSIAIGALSNSVMSVSAEFVDLTSTFAGNASTISQSLVTLSTADYTTSTAVTTLASTTANGQADLKSALTTTVDATKSTASSLIRLGTSFGDSTASASQQITAQSTSTQSVAGSITAFAAAFAGQSASYNQAVSTFANAERTTSTSVATLTAAQGSALGAIVQNSTVTATALSTTATVGTNLATSLGQSTASASTMLVAQSTSTQSVAGSIISFSASFGAQSSGYNQYVANLANAQKATSTSVTALSATQGQNNSQLVQTLTTTTNQSQTIANSLTALSSQFGAQQASYSQQQTTQSSATQSVAGSITAFSASFANNASGYNQSLATFANAQNTTSTSVTTLNAAYGNNTTALRQALTVNTSSTASTATATQNLASSFANNAAGAYTAQVAQSTAQQSVAGSLANYMSQVGGAFSSVSQTVGTITNSVSTLSSSVQTLSSSFAGGGGSANDLPNSDWIDGTYDGWAIGFTDANGTSGINLSSAQTNGYNYFARGGTNINVVYVTYGGTPSGNAYIDFYSPSVSAQPGARYEGAVDAAVHRAARADVYIQFNDAGGNAISYAGPFSGGLLLSSNQYAGANGDPANYQRIGGFGTAPSGTCSRRLLMRLITDGETNPYGFFTRPLSRTATGNQTALSPYAPGTQANVPLLNSTITTNAQTAANANATTASMVTALASSFSTGGGSGNLLANSDFVGGTYDGWFAVFSTTGGSSGINLGSYSSPAGVPGVLWAQYAGAPAANENLGWAGGANASTRVPVVPNQRYEISMYAAFHRMLRCDLYVRLFDVNGTSIGQTGLGGGGRNGGAANGDVSNFDQIGGFFTVPSGCAYVSPLVYGISSGGNNPYIFVTRPQIRLATPNQTQLSPYVSGAQVNVPAIQSTITTNAKTAADANAATASLVTQLTSSFSGGAGGANMIANSDMNGIDNYAFGTTSSASSHGVAQLGNGVGRYYGYLPTGSYAGDINDLRTPRVTVVAGQIYEASVAAQNDGTNGAILYIEWFNGSGGSLGSSQWQGATGNDFGQVNGSGIPPQRIGGFAAAPSGAVSANLLLRQARTPSGNYVNFAQPMLRQASPNQTALSPYQPGTQANVALLNSTITTNAKTAADANASTASMVTQLTSTYNKGSQSGGNDLLNSELLGGSDGWTKGGNIAFNLLYNPQGYSSGSVNVLAEQVGTAAQGGQVADIYSPDMPAEPNTTYEASVLTSFQGPASTALYMGFRNSSGGVLAYSAQALNNAAGTPLGGDVSGYARIGMFAVAPAGTCSRFLLLRTFASTAANVVGFFTHPFSRTALPTQTQLSPYQPGAQVNVLQINSTITTNAKTAADANAATASMVATLTSSFSGGAGGANMIANSDMNGIDNYSYANTGISGAQHGSVAVTNGQGRYYSYLPAGSGFADFRTPRCAVVAGQIYEASVAAENDFGGGCATFFEWSDVNGSVFKYDQFGGTNYSNAIGANGIPAYRMFGFATAPGGAAFCTLLLRHNANGGNAGYANYAQPMLRIASPNQSQASPYQPGTQANVALLNSTITTNAKTAADANASTAGALQSLTSTFSTGVGGGNLLVNSDFVAGYDGWVLNGSIGGAVSGINIGGYGPSGGTPGVLWAHYSGTPDPNNVLQWNCGNQQYTKVPVVVGQRYEISMYAAVHRMARAEIYAVLADATGNGYQNVGLASGGRRYTGNAAANRDAGQLGDVRNFDQIGGFVTIPDGCSYVYVLVQGVTSGENEPYVFLTRPQIRLASPNQSQLSSYLAGAQVNVANITTQATTTASRVDGLSAKYVVALALNGQTGGFDIQGVQRADGTGGVFTMTINANVVINGSLIVNGTIIRNHLDGNTQAYFKTPDSVSFFNSPGNGSFVVPAGITRLLVEVWGAGGGGGQGGGQGGGGNGGGYAFAAISVTPGAGCSYAVGAGGGAPNGNGGNSSFTYGGTSVSASGGQGWGGSPGTGSAPAGGFTQNGGSGGRSYRLTGSDDSGNAVTLQFNGAGGGGYATPSSYGAGISPGGGGGDGSAGGAGMVRISY